MVHKRSKRPHRATRAATIWQNGVLAGKAVRAAQFVVAMSGKSVTLTRQLSEEHTAGGDEKPRRLTVDDVPSLRMTRKTDRKSSLFENDEYFTPRSLATSLGGLTIAAEKEPKADMVFAAICQALDAGIDDATTCEHGCVAVTRAGGAEGWLFREDSLVRP